MNLDEAIAVYLLLIHTDDHSSRQQRVLSRAWGVICEEAEKVIAREPAKQGDFE